MPKCSVASSAACSSVYTGFLFTGIGCAAGGVPRAARSARRQAGLLDLDLDLSEEVRRKLEPTKTSLGCRSGARVPMEGTGSLAAVHAARLEVSFARANTAPAPCVRALGRLTAACPAARARR